MECQVKKKGNVLVADLSGQFTFSDHSTFKTILNNVEEAEISHINIDLEHVEFIDSAGLGMLLLLRDQCEKFNKRLALIRPVGQVKKVFDVSKFEHLFSIEN